MTPTEIITPRRILDSPSQHGKTFRHFVPESRFGIWFISSKIWSEHVLKVAIDDLAPLIPDRRRSYPTILDFGCGFGASFKMLQERFRPSRIIGVDCDPRMLSGTHLEARQQGLPIDVALVASEGIPLVDQSIDMIFCHQTFHHVIDQRGVLAEFRRVLKPEGLLLFAESTRTFIKSWIIRLLFRHPMDTQRDASELYVVKTCWTS